MSLPFEDHSIYDDPDYFGDVAVYDPTTSFAGIFKNGFIEVNGVETEGLLFSCATANLPPTLVHEEEIEIKSKFYRVVSIQHDGTGRTRLLLEEVDF